MFGKNVPQQAQTESLTEAQTEAHLSWLQAEAGGCDRQAAGLQRYPTIHPVIAA